MLSWGLLFNCGGVILEKIKDMEKMEQEWEVEGV